MEPEHTPPYAAYAAIMAGFCGGLAAAGLGATQIIAPRFGRLLAWTLGAAGLNDFLQAGFAALTSKSNEIEERVGYS